MRLPRRLHLRPAGYLYVSTSNAVALHMLWTDRAGKGAGLSLEAPTLVRFSLSNAPRFGVDTLLLLHPQQSASPATT